MKFQISFKAKVIFSLFITLLLANVVMAQSTITKPYTFRGGQPARAKEVNENFDRLYQKINELSEKVTKLDNVKGCNWEGWKCDCKNDISGASGYVKIGMKCKDGVLVEFKVVDIGIKRYSLGDGEGSDNPADCSEAAACP